MIGAGLRILVVGAGIGGLVPTERSGSAILPPTSSSGPRLKSVRIGGSLQQLSQRDDAVTVEFGNGTADRYDLVIGADGTHATVRQVVGGAGAVRPVGSSPGPSSPSARR